MFFFVCLFWLKSYFFVEVSFSSRLKEAVYFVSPRDDNRPSHYRHTNLVSFCFVTNSPRNGRVVVHQHGVQERRLQRSQRRKAQTAQGKISSGLFFLNQARAHCHQWRAINEDRAQALSRLKIRKALKAKILILF